MVSIFKPSVGACSRLWCPFRSIVTWQQMGHLAGMLSAFPF